jgi:SAM-dependent methyltransferase
MTVEPACGLLPFDVSQGNSGGSPLDSVLVKNYFDEPVAATYDQSTWEEFQPATIEATVDLLAEHARGRRALELGIGTGRIALPLAARGVPVSGIDLSEAMVSRLRAKPGGEKIDVAIGDFSTTRVEGSFSLAYLVYNGIENLTTQEAQVACFRNVAAHLEPGGRFVVEVGVPGLQHLPPGSMYEVFHGSDDYWGIDQTEVVNQGSISHHIRSVDGRYERVSMPFRYVWPSELDLMAELAEMRLLERRSGWNQDPFTGESRKHISVWEKAEPVHEVPAAPVDYFDESTAKTNDDTETDEFDDGSVETSAEFLAGLAGEGSALELGIGTGRIALPLAERGVRVHGVDLSKPMLTKLREKPGGADIGITVGDMSTTQVEGSFSLVYLVCNTIMNLTTQEAQVACFRNAAAHLQPGGCFVIKVMVPELRRLPPGETFQVFHGSDNYWGIDEYDVVNQGLISHHIENVDGSYERASIPFRYVWPSELDLMAQLAGMKLTGRWEGWERQPFTSDSRQHVSVWEKPA